MEDIEDIDSYNRCSIEAINKIIFKFKSYEDLLKLSNLRSKEEILTKFDLITRYYWAFREIDKVKLASKLNEGNKTFGEDKMKECIEYVLRLKKIG